VRGKWPVQYRPLTTDKPGRDKPCPYDIWSRLLVTDPWGNIFLDLSLLPVLESPLRKESDV